MLDIDKLYYIMDYTGHYFRLNDKDDLAIARDMDEATVFSFAEANRRINGGHKSKFYMMTPVDEGHEEYSQNEEEASMTGNFASAIISVAKDLRKNEIHPASSELIEPTVTVASTLSYELSEIDWKEYLTHFTYVIGALSGYRDSLIKAESDVDLKICDILHYIELCDTTTEEAAGLVDLLKECREHRRNVKDEIIRLDAFQRNVGTSANLAKAKETLKCIAGLETRKYTPRKLCELFEGRAMKMPTTGEKPHEEKRMIRERPAVVYEERKEIEEMEYIRRETVFDGKENDWMAFAMQQAEFYRNANQYIINLKLDIEGIEDEIADLMDEIDSSNCNVAQGYKLFKRLKELRIKRKEKEKELECLYILTERFDMNYMAAECEDNAYELDKLLYPEVVASETEETVQVEESSIEGNPISMAV